MSVTGIILAGGRGTRLGGIDKALVEIGGHTAIERVRFAISSIVVETIAVVNDERSRGFEGVTLIRDPDPHAGVLPALLAALGAATQPMCLLVACDMPFLNERLLGWLVERAENADVVLPIVEGREEPMHAVYRREPCRDAIAEALARGDRRMISFLEGLRVYRAPESELREIDPELRSFFNINTPEDLDCAIQLAHDFDR